MSPSTSASCDDGEKPAFDMLREVATTLYPRSRNAWTTAAPMPCEAPVTMTVFLLAILKSSSLREHGVDASMSEHRARGQLVPWQKRNVWSNHIVRTTRNCALPLSMRA